MFVMVSKALKNLAVPYIHLIAPSMVLKHNKLSNEKLLTSQPFP